MGARAPKLLRRGHARRGDDRGVGRSRKRKGRWGDRGLDSHAEGGAQILLGRRCRGPGALRIRCIYNDLDGQAAQLERDPDRLHELG
jgi:hypothetical protein